MLAHPPTEPVCAGAEPDEDAGLASFADELKSTTWLAGSARRRLADGGTRRRRRRLLTPPPFRYPGVKTNG